MTHPPLVCSVVKLLARRRNIRDPDAPKIFQPFYRIKDIEKAKSSKNSVKCMKSCSFLASTTTFLSRVLFPFPLCFVPNKQVSSPPLTFCLFVYAPFQAFMYVDRFVVLLFLCPFPVARSIVGFTPCFINSVVPRCRFLFCRPVEYLRACYASNFCRVNAK